jgi:hypothetical protein
MTVEQWARKQAADVIGAKVKAIEEAKRLYMQEINDDAFRQRQQYSAMASQLAGLGVPGVLRGIYGGAAHDIAGLAGGMAGQMGAAINESARLNQNMVSGTGQEASLAGQGGILGEVVGYTEGTIPANTYGAHGEALAEEAALQPGFGLQIGHGDVEQTRREALKGLKDFMLQIAETKAGQPELFLELRGARQEELAAQKKARLDEYLRKAALAEAMGDKRQSEYWKRKAYELELRKQNRYEMKDKGLTPDGKLLPGFVWRDPNDHSKGTTKPKTPKGEGAGGKYTPGQQQEFIENVRSDDTAEKINDEIQRQIKRGVWTPSAGRNRIAGHLLKLFGYMAPTAAAKRELRKVIAQILDDMTLGPQNPNAPAPPAGGGGDDFYDVG